MGHTWIVGYIFTTYNRRGKKSN